MQHLNTLWHLAGTAAQVAELARRTQVYSFNAPPNATFYMHTAGAEVRVTRWDARKIEVFAQLQAQFGWRIETDQDDAGVYFVAHRRPVVGGLAGAAFTVSVPPDCHLMLRLDDCRLTLDGVQGTFEIPAVGSKKFLAVSN
jgi:hypothetical protein